MWDKCVNTKWMQKNKSLHIHLIVFPISSKRKLKKYPQLISPTEQKKHS